MLVRVMGWLVMIEGAFMLVPLFTALIYAEKDLEAFAAGTAITAVTGACMTFLSRPRRSEMGKREGFLLTALVWVVFSVFGMIPFIISDVPLNVSEAFFEAMSGFTTTGVSVMQDIDNISRALHIWRSLMQWIGGMGIILFTLAVLPMLNSSGGMQMFNAEVTGITHDKIRPRISQTAKMLWLIYIGFTALLIFLLWLGPMSLFESVCHAFGAISTGGYSTNDQGVSAWHDYAYVKIVLIVFMFIGGVNFGLIYRTLRGEYNALRKNDVFRTYVMIIGLMLVLFVITIISRGQVTDWQAVTLDPLFQIVSTITSTGFTVSNFESWGPFVLSLTFVMMFFGSCAGSTSGGAKIDRVLYLFKNAHNELYRSLYPNAILAVKINGRVVNPDLVNKVIAFLCIYMLLVVAGGLSLTLFGVPLVDAFFSSFSCISNTGLGAGVTGYGNSYDILPDATKWILSALMLIGRLEIFTVLVLLTPAFWRR